MRARISVLRFAAVVGLASGLVAAQPASAQYWATREVCDVQNVRIDTSVISPTELAALRAKTAAMPNANGNYWQITAPNGAVSYLWGTMHSTNPLALRLPLQVETQVRNSRVAAFEFNPVPATRRLLELNRNPPDIFLPFKRDPKSVSLPPEVRGWVDSRLIALGWGLDAADWLTPGGLAEVILMHPCDDFAAGIYPTQDSFLQTLAAIGGARILGLEPPDQLRKKLNKPEHAGLARDFLRLYGGYLSPDLSEAENATGFALYLSGENGVARLFERGRLGAYWGETEGPDLQDRVDAYLLDERNHTFVKNLSTELATGGVFAAVGSWHIPGENGMVRLLRQEGFQVERILLDRERPSP